MLSTLIYRKQDARTWKLKQSSYEAFQGGAGWDNMPSREDMALVYISPTLCALAIRTGYANMGWGMEYYSLLAVVGEEIKNIFSTTFSEGNGGVGDNVSPTNWQSTLRLKPSTGAHYDIHLDRKGVYKAQNIDYSVVYQYDAGHYTSTTLDMVMQKD